MDNIVHMRAIELLFMHFFGVKVHLFQIKILMHDVRLLISCQTHKYVTFSYYGACSMKFGFDAHFYEK